MLITRSSIYSNISRTREIDISEQQYNDWLRTQQPIQQAFPHLSENDREFILTGMTEEEWEDFNALEQEIYYSGDYYEEAF